jgi:hypothetical protein
MKEKSWIRLVLFVVFVGSLMAWHVDRIGLRLSKEIAGLREQIAGLTEKLSVKNPAITEQKDIPYVQRGALKYPIGIDGKEINSNLYFHEIQFDSTIGHQIGTLGAMEYILDSSGRKISDEFHEFFMKGSQLWGRLGATEKPVILKN